MSNEEVARPEIHHPGDRPSSSIEQRSSTDETPAAPVQNVSLSKEGTLQLNHAAIAANDTNIVDNKSDSEAETVVLDGKHERSGPSTGKAIKNEEDSDGDRSQSPKINGFHHFPRSDERSDHGNDRPSLKRKRPSQKAITEEHAPSSNLSSTISSPAGHVHSSRDSGSESDNTRSTPPLDEAIHQPNIHSRKRKIAANTNDHDRNKRGKSDPNSVAIRRKERRDTRSATHHETPRPRSESPPSRRHKRAQSAQSADLPDKNNKRKKAPPPLPVERRRKASEDIHGDSDDSSSAHSHPHLQKVVSVDHAAISPAKISMKGSRDRNGRTLLARACAGDFAEAQRRLKERPQDIDVPDYAGNTPLQIASLEGFADVVELLLQAGCDIYCKNIDMETPLIDAVENGHLRVVQLLLRAGLDPRQSNAKGEEPLDLVNLDSDDYDEIRAELIAAKESNVVRRPSEDQSAHHRDNDQSSVGASAASPTDGQTGKSPPPLSSGARRRTARSQQTQDSLLWVNPTPAKLREACGRGDLAVVDYILKMRPEVGTDAVIAAARGGHDVVLEILFAIGKLAHDPDPVESDDFKPGRNTPMLAAIGRGHIAVIKLLVSQRGFNPTRRIFRGLTYHELAKERQGSNWEEEYNILKEAHDDYKINGGKRSNHGSPRKVRTKKSTLDAPVSPTAANRQLSLSSVKTAPEPEIKREHSHKAPSNKHLHLSEEAKDSAVLSDRETGSASRPAPKPKVARSVSDAGAFSSKQLEGLKPRRKLLSRNDLKSDQDTKRRASLASDGSCHEHPRRQPGDHGKPGQEKKKGEISESSNSIPKAEGEQSKDIYSSQLEPGKKRSRPSASPQPLETQGEKVPTVLKKKKKRRIDTEGNVVIKDPQYRDELVRPGPAQVATMIASPEQVISPSEPPHRAPVANMGVSTASPVTKSPTEVMPQAEMYSPMSGIENPLLDNDGPQMLHERRETDTSMADRHDENPQRRSSNDQVGEHQQASETEWQAKPPENPLQDKKEFMLTKEEKEVRTKSQSKDDKLTWQEKELRKEEETKRRHREYENERAARRRLEAQRRAEHEEQERQRRIRLQEEEQQRLRDALPNSLRRAAELTREEAQQPRQAKRFLPLYTVTTGELHPGFDGPLADERWIANVQAAPILAVNDLDLSQYTAWTRLPLTPGQRQSLWRQVRNQMSQADINPLTFTWAEAIEMDQGTHPKFIGLKSMFWVKLAEFLDIVPRHPHLAGLKLRTRPMVLHEHPWGPGGRPPGESGGGGGGGGDDGGGGVVDDGEEKVVAEVGGMVNGVG
ncbi:MAG: hypothetical protein Q9219_003102 [cf. Caloplaca sp. 3 TL-2023]